MTLQKSVLVNAEGVHLSDAVGVDAGDDDGRVAADAEPETLVFPFPEPDQSRRRPVVLGREDGDRAEAAEQVLDLVLAEVGVGQRDLEVSLGHNRGWVQNLLKKIEGSIWWMQ